jgi:hypothetical protein
VHALDAEGQGVIALRANPPDGVCAGYLAPDFAALDVLLAVGATRPTAAEAATWIEWADKLVCAAGEAANAASFRRWLGSVVDGTWRP